MQHISVAYPLRVQGLPTRERRAVGAAQDPTAVPLAVVGEPGAGMPKNLRKKISQGYVLRQRDVDAAVRCVDGDQGETGLHRPSSITWLR
ncbi:hypothetical protein Afe04nite_81900 [Asanoa ferruginea]|nr:hypothetical protein Afe04nite_81900 [Asanoa ferruginea]